MKRLSLTLQALIKFGLQAEFYAFRQLRIVEKFAYDIGGKISRELLGRLKWSVFIPQQCKLDLLPQ